MSSELVATYFSAVRTDAGVVYTPAGEVTETPASIVVEEKEFHAAHWASAMGKPLVKGKSPSDAMPIPRGEALELLNRWNRYSDHGEHGRECKYWIK